MESVADELIIDDSTVADDAADASEDDDAVDECLDILLTIFACEEPFLRRMATVS